MSYALVAGGHNFREKRADRVKNRYYHKQEAFVREFGMPSCVGCGRCIENCPTGINVVEVFQYVRGEAMSVSLPEQLPRPKRTAKAGHRCQPVRCRPRPGSCGFRS